MCLAWRQLQTNKLCQYSVPSNLSPCISIAFCVATGLCLSSAAAWLFPASLISHAPFHHRSLSLSLCAFSRLNLHSLSSTEPSYTPTIAARAQASRLAFRLGAQMVLWLVSQLWVSEPAGRQDGRTALLWPIWRRPVLAPVCDYGAAGGWQGWHTERTLPVHSRPGD